MSWPTGDIVYDDSNSEERGDFARKVKNNYYGQLLHARSFQTQRY